MIRKKYIQPFIRKMGGYDQIEEEIATLFYIIDNGMDITSFPKATGLLRQTQLVDAELLRIFHEICRKNNLSYWLDYGTLLGAVRHGGFIPWDDDLDVAMPRRDYDRIYPILCEELSGTGIEVIDAGERRKAITIWKAGAIMDIFPMDCVSNALFEDQAKLKEAAHEYRRYYQRNRASKSISELNSKKEEMIGEPDYENPLWYHNPEFCADETVFDSETIFPLREIEFEGYLLLAPNDCEAYLRECYGDYMGFPHGGVLHHSGGNGIHIFQNSVKHGIDMLQMRSDLRKIERK